MQDDPGNRVRIGVLVGCDQRRLIQPNGSTPLVMMSEPLPRSHSTELMIMLRSRRSGRRGRSGADREFAKPCSIAEPHQHRQVRPFYGVPSAPAYGTRSQWSTNVPNAPLPVAVTQFPSNAICGSPCSGSCISTRIPVIVTGEAPLSPDRS